LLFFLFQACTMFLTKDSNLFSAPEDISILLDNMLHDDSTLDFTFVIHGEIVKSHRLVLLSSSSVFKNMITDCLGEKFVISIGDPLITSKNFRSFIQFLYLKRVIVTVQNCFELCYLANIYDVPSLLIHCKQFMHTTLTPARSVSYYMQSILYNNSDLRESSKKVLFTNEALLSLEPQSLNEDMMKMIAKSDEIQIEEIDLFLLLERWIEVNPDSKIIDELLSYIRYGLISGEDLTKRVKVVNRAPKPLYILALEYFCNKDVEVPTNFAKRRGTVKLSWEDIPNNRRKRELESNSQMSGFGINVIGTKAVVVATVWANLLGYSRAVSWSTFSSNSLLQSVYFVSDVTSSYKEIYFSTNVNSLDPKDYPVIYDLVACNY